MWGSLEFPHWSTWVLISDLADKIWFTIQLEQRRASIDQIVVVEVQEPLVGLKCALKSSRSPPQLVKIMTFSNEQRLKGSKTHFKVLNEYTV